MKTKASLILFFSKTKGGFAQDNKRTYHRQKSRVFIADEASYPADARTGAQAKKTATSAREKKLPARNDRPLRCRSRLTRCSSAKDGDASAVAAKSSQESTCSGEIEIDRAWATNRETAEKMELVQNNGAKQYTFPTINVNISIHTVLCHL